VYANGPGGSSTLAYTNSITTPVPSGPSSVSSGGNNLTAEQITISWSAAPGATSYYLSGSGVSAQSGITGTSFTYYGITAGTYGPFTVQSFAGGTAGGSNSTGAVTMGGSVANVQYSRGVVTCSQTSSTTTSGSYQGVTFTWQYSISPQYGDTSAINNGGSFFRSPSGRYDGNGYYIGNSGLGGYAGEWFQLILSKALVFNRVYITYGEYDVPAGTYLMGSNDGTNWTTFTATGYSINASINWGFTNTTAYSRYAMLYYQTRNVLNQGTFLVPNGQSWFRQ
jgi:hypothetical protein